MKELLLQAHWSKMKIRDIHPSKTYIIDPITAIIRPKLLNPECYLPNDSLRKLTPEQVNHAIDHLSEQLKEDEKPSQNYKVYEKPLKNYTLCETKETLIALSFYILENLKILQDINNLQATSKKLIDNNLDEIVQNKKNYIFESLEELTRATYFLHMHKSVAR